MQQGDLHFDTRNDQKIFTVCEITAAIRDLLESEFFNVRIEGEISNTRKASSGHYYFTLKDEHAQIRCICFRQNAAYLKSKPVDGLKVLARGRVGVYEIRGDYQFYIESLEPQGIGALQLAFEQMKKKLAAEGLFDDERKRPLPFFPQRIGIVTSSTGAVISDMVRVMERRFQGLIISLYPVRVQGQGSIGDIVEALDYFSSSKSVDVVIIGRGGGSLEDLWTFNEEVVARSVARSAVPVISAVGHQTDFTITDFAADVRASTPSAAAEMVIRPKSDFEEIVQGFHHQIDQSMRFRIALWHRTLNQTGFEQAKSLLRSKFSASWQRCDEQGFCLRQAITRHFRNSEHSIRTAKDSLMSRDVRLSLARARSRLESLSNYLGPSIQRHFEKLGIVLDSLDRQRENLSPLNVLGRGYAIVHDDKGIVVRKSNQTTVGDSLQVRLHRGRLRVHVDESTSQ
ncbi:MAG: exodeoxyribonuclease VII large subunit [Solibacterales bacterium]|nr:exodeoxyribonuclease VII large subunit [Bryobacterales bacterium]|tara:strand:+ start:3907 stop:5274 length:1368 start_codon:yes stop_codon:yes gene_type:complete